MWRRKEVEGLLAEDGCLCWWCGVSSIFQLKFAIIR